MSAPITGRLLWQSTELGEDISRAGHAFLVVEVPIQVARDASPMLGEPVDVRESGAVPCSTAELVALMRVFSDSHATANDQRSEGAREGNNSKRDSAAGVACAFASVLDDLRHLAGLPVNWREVDL